MKVLLAVDGSDYTRKMIDYLTRHEELLGRNDDCTVLHVEPVLPPHARGAMDKQAAGSYQSEEARKVLDPVLDALRAQGRRAGSAYVVGAPGEAIARFATEGGYDLVAMGSRGHGALLRMMLGSVSTQVLANCEVPVLLIR